MRIRALSVLSSSLCALALGSTPAEAIDTNVSGGGCAGVLRVENNNSSNLSPYLSAYCSTGVGAAPAYLAYTKFYPLDGTVRYQIGNPKTMRRTADGKSYVTDGFRQFGVFWHSWSFFDACALITSNGRVLLDTCRFAVKNSALWGTWLNWA